MKCATGKRVFESEALAEEALIQNHVRNDYSRQTNGPTNIYQCRDCGFWHFTSKGGLHPMFEDEGVQERIKRERAAYHWEQRLR